MMQATGHPATSAMVPSPRSRWPSAQPAASRGKHMPMMSTTVLTAEATAIAIAGFRQNGDNVAANSPRVRPTKSSANNSEVAIGSRFPPTQAVSCDRQGWIPLKDCVARVHRRDSSAPCAPPTKPRRSPIWPAPSIGTRPEHRGQKFETFQTARCRSPGWAVPLRPSP